MTTNQDLKDMFAAMAMQGLLADQFTIGNLKSLAEVSYRAAEAMLEERAKRMKI